MQLRSVKSYTENLSDIWGYRDASGNEYAIVGVFNGVSIVNVTDPDNINEMYFIPGASSIWRDIKTWNDHAYVTNESSGGLLIIDLSTLPNAINTATWIADSMLNTAHNIFIDEKGFAYLFGYNNVKGNIPNAERGALIADLNGDPMQPTVAGVYNVAYVHDGFARGDTLWTSEFSNGYFGVVNVSDKSNPELLATQETPSHKTHNCWLSNDGKTLYTTDETSAAFVTAYDVSSLDNITELDRYQAEPGSGLIPHNTYVLNNFLVTSYYKYGVNIIDVSNPDNMVEVGYYDTSPFPSGDGFQGCWGVYPFLPSGNILASDIETGLYVLTPTYLKGCYIEGNITDEETGSLLSGVTIEIMTTNNVATSNLLGDYKSGTVEPGSYDVRFIKAGCIPKIIPRINLSRGITTKLNTTMICTTLVSVPYNNPSKQIYMTAYPTVFHHTTNIVYHFPDGLLSGNNNLNFYNVSGQQLFSIDLTYPEGAIEFGSRVPKGIYIAQLQGPTSSKILKLIKN